MNVSFQEKIISALGYIPFLCFIPYLAPESPYTVFHRKISFFLLSAEVFFLFLALLPSLKKGCFFLFAVCLSLSLLGMLLSLLGFHGVRKE